MIGTATSKSNKYPELDDLIISTRDEYERIKNKAKLDLVIDEIDLDNSVLKTPRLLGEYNDLFSDNVITLKEMYAYKKKVDLERWKYYNGKQTTEYYAKNGVVHEKILKTDLDRYLSADEKLEKVNNLINIQKTLTEYIERVIKELQTRNFHCRVAVDWRKFQSGG